MKKVGIVGPRTLPIAFRPMVVGLLDTLPAGTLVVSGGAKGVDSWAEEAARARPDLPEPLIIRPDYKAFPGRPWYAPLDRNTKVVETVDRLCAFWDEMSRGTRDTIEKAWHAGKLRYLQRCIGLGESTQPPPLIGREHIGWFLARHFPQIQPPFS